MNSCCFLGNCRCLRRRTPAPALSSGLSSAPYWAPAIETSRRSSRGNAAGWRFGDLIGHDGEEDDDDDYESEAEFDDGGGGTRDSKGKKKNESEPADARDRRTEEGNFEVARKNSHRKRGAKQTSAQRKKIKTDDDVEGSTGEGEVESENSDSGISDMSDVYDSQDDDGNERSQSSDTGHTGSTTEDEDDEEGDVDVNEMEEELLDLQGGFRRTRESKKKKKKHRQSAMPSARQPSGQQPTARHRHRKRSENREEGEEDEDNEDADDDVGAIFDVDDAMIFDDSDNDDQELSETVAESAITSGDGGRRRVRGAVLVDDTHEATFAIRVRDWRIAQRQARTTQRELHEERQEQVGFATTSMGSSSSSTGNNVRTEVAHQDLVLSGGDHGGPTVILDPTIAPRLLSYQREGVSWMWSLRARGAGGILADEMGLGKTVQAAAYLLACAQAGELRPSRDGPALVLCPATVRDKGRGVEDIIHVLV